MEKTDKLLEALKANDAPSGEGKTAAELCQELGQHRETVLEKLRKLHAQGRIKVQTVKRMDMAGRLASVPSYIFIDQPAKKKNSA